MHGRRPAAGAGEAAGQPRWRRRRRAGSGSSRGADPVRAWGAVRVLGADGGAGPAAGVLRGRGRLLGLPVVRAGVDLLRRRRGRQRRPVARGGRARPGQPPQPVPGLVGAVRPLLHRRRLRRRRRPHLPGRRGVGHRPPPRPRQRHRRPRLGVPAGARPAAGVRDRLQRRQHRLDPARPPDPAAVPAGPGGPARRLPRLPVQPADRPAGAVGRRPGAARTGCRACGRSRGPASPCRGSTRRSPPTTRGRRSPRSTSPTTPVQRRFHEAAGGAPDEFAAALLGNLAAIRATTPNFRSCLLEGSAHCALPRPEFYTLTSGGVRLRDWVAAQAEGRPVPNLPPG